MSTPLVRLCVRSVLSLVCVAALAACSFSHSSDSSSDSSDHSSDSSTSSSGSSTSDDDDKDKDNARFDRDVEAYTLAFLEAGGQDAESFFAGLGDVARRHGVSDWEAEPAVWEAIGRGLARSQASAAERSAWQMAWTGGDASRQSAVAKGLSTVQ